MDDPFQIRVAAISCGECEITLGLTSDSRHDLMNPVLLNRGASERTLTFGLALAANE